jgi:hypothetical protein
MEGRSGLRGSVTGSEIAQFSEAALPDECEGKRASPQIIAACASARDDRRQTTRGRVLRRSMSTTCG